MSRPKSPKRLALERDRAVRKEERERKRAEKERNRTIRMERRERKLCERNAKREAKLKKRQTHESIIRNGVPKIKTNNLSLSLRDIITYSPRTFCPSCSTAVDESSLIGEVCERCHYKKEMGIKD